MKKLILLFVLILCVFGLLFAQTIGNNAEGTLSDLPYGSINAIRVACTQSMIATKMYVKIGTSGNGTIKCAIYSDEGGTPETFLRGTNQLTNPGTGWKSFDLTSGLSLDSGMYYHLVLWTNSTGYAINYTSVGNTPYKELTYGAWPTSFGTLDGTGPGHTYCIFATGTGGECASPAIVNQPQSITRNIETSALFSVTATGTSLTYQWKKDGTDISGAISSSFTISRAARSDAGDYTVVVGGACGSPVTSDTAVLKVVTGTTYYISTTGIDNAGRDGSITNPWKTLSYACTRVTTSGDTIFVTAGTYNESKQIVKPLGVHICGEGVTSHIVSTYSSASAAQAAIQCASTTGSLANDGGSISHIRLTGSNLTSTKGIYVGYRNNVSIHDCTVEDFLNGGIWLHVSNNYLATYATGNSITNCIINNSASGAYQGNDSYPGAIRVSGQTQCNVLNNVIDMTARTPGQNGSSIEFQRCKKIRIDGNTFYRNDYEANSWNFFFEGWDYGGDFEYTNNIHYGLAKVSFGGDANKQDADCSFGVKAIGNKFYNPKVGFRTINGYNSTLYCICVEGDKHVNVKVSKNYIQNFGVGVELSTPSSAPDLYWKHNWEWDHIDVSYNIFDGIGYQDHAYSHGVWWINETMTAPYHGTYNDVEIYNNTIIGNKGTGNRGYQGIGIYPNGTVTNINVSNNIVYDFSNYAIYVDDHASDGLVLTNAKFTYNDMYSNGVNSVYLSTTITDTNVDISTGNIKTDPMFVSVSDFHLKAGSPCINAGINAGLTTDYDGVAVSSPPEIGAYEYNYTGSSYYISTSGTDGAGIAGGITTPWKTLSYACTRATTIGDIINVGAGTFTETAQSKLAVGVSIVGAGNTSIITTAKALDPIILALSPAGTNGNQSISNITINGDSLAITGIRVYGRSNVIIHHVEVRRTIRYGITMTDAASRSVHTAPTHYITGCEIHDVKMTDCGRDTWSTVDKQWQADAAIDISGGDGMLLYNIDIDNVTGGRYAYGIKGLYGGGYHKGLKIYRCKIRTSIRDIDREQSFGFNIELWTGVGGIEIYDNDFNGCIDMGGYGYWDAHSYGYAFKVYDNIIIQDTRPTYQGEAGLILEGGGKDGCYFYRNWVENFSTGLTLGTTAASLVQGCDDVDVWYNVFSNIGYTSGGAGAGVSGYNLTTGAVVNGLRILNNVFHKVNNASGWGVNFEYSDANTWTNCQIRNNIIYNAYTPVQFRNQTINGMNIDNNIVYGHTRNTIPDYTYSTVINNTFNNNQVGVNPLFINPGSDFRLQFGSPAIDAGIHLSIPFITTDYDSVTIGNPPDIGAFEFVNAGNHPPSFNDQSFQLYENSPNGTVVGTVVASDPDEGQKLSFSIVSNNTNDAFSINDSTGVISVANSSALNFDFALVVKVQDNSPGKLSSQATITIHLVSTGIELTGYEEAIKVYPNPVSDELIIEYKGNNDRLSFIILNSTGQSVFKGTLVEKAVVQTTMLSPGTYFLILQSDKSFEFKKIIKLLN